jgi:tripartite-type tricarboxylate transporter receptor subunit TctC
MRYRVGRRALLAVAALGGSVGAAHVQAADNFPQRSLRWIVPVPPGATTDILSRLVAGKLAEAWGQQVIVDNRSGGAFVVGTEIVARASPDGHTVGLLLSPHAVSPFVMKDLPYDAVKDFTPIVQVANVPGVLVTNVNVPVTSVKEIVALAKAKPGTLNYGSAGQLSSGHLSMELLNLMGGIRITHVPYKGGAPAINDLIGGQIQFVILGPPTVMGHVKSGRLKAIATTAAKRSPGLPDTPTFAEAGLPGFDTFEWYGVFGPAKVPRASVLKFNAEVNRIIALPDVKERMLGLGAIPAGGTPEAFAGFVKEEMNRWGKVARQVNLRPD